MVRHKRRARIKMKTRKTIATKRNIVQLWVPDCPLRCIRSCITIDGLYSKAWLGLAFVRTVHTSHKRGSKRRFISITRLHRTTKWLLAKMLVLET